MIVVDASALLEALPTDGAAIVNADNYWCREMAENVASYLVTYGTWEDADVYGTKARVTVDGVGFDLYDRMPFEVPALGLHNVHNALAAIAVAPVALSPSPSGSALSMNLPVPLMLTRNPGFAPLGFPKSTTQVPSAFCAATSTFSTFFSHAVQSAPPFAASVSLIIM